MLITRRNYNEIFDKLVRETYDSVADYLENKPNGYRTMTKNKLIIDLMRDDQPFFLGRMNGILISLTMYELGIKWLGKSQDAAEAYAQGEESKRLSDNTFYWKYFSVYDFAAEEKAIDPWGHNRYYVPAKNIQGFKIHNVIPEKQTVIASILFYDGYNIYQSKMMQMSRHKGQWYLSKDSSYSSIESNINNLYTIQKY
jgi:hypothetical protein